MNKTIKYADFWTRLLAHNIDLLPILMLFYAATWVIEPSRYDYLLLTSIYFGYYIIFESSKYRATPGKILTKIKIANSDYKKASLLKVVLRNISKFLSLLICFSGFVLIFFDGKRRALHDYIGGTLVLFDED
ncbi:RDD family protein [Ekhidna sp.]|uniref:RDD family protein n=1 Tax=Ekhidna sp. TaxID=2608089 RepID=UPI003B50A475